jgi:hypothetical protein
MVLHVLCSHCELFGTGRGRRKLHEEQRHTFNFSLDIIRVIKRRDKMGRACGTHGRDEKSTQNLKQRTEGMGTYA